MEIEEIIIHYLPVKEYSQVKELLKDQQKHIETLKADRVITDNSKVNIFLAEENERLKKDLGYANKFKDAYLEHWQNSKEENTKLKEEIKKLEHSEFYVRCSRGA